MLSEEKRAEINSDKTKSGVMGQWYQNMAVVDTLLAIHDELELIRKALTTPVVEKEKPPTGKAKG